MSDTHNSFHLSTPTSQFPTHPLNFEPLRSPIEPASFPLYREDASSIENLPLDVLLRSEHVKKLWNSYQEASQTIVKLSKNVSDLHNENKQLRQRIESGGGSMFSALDRTRQSAIPALHSRHSSISLAPSDSASQVHPSPAPPASTTTTAIRSSVRPSEFNESVLWTLADCLDDPHARPLASNKSRPPMDKALRNSDGTMIDLKYYKKIQTDVSTFCKSNLAHLPEPTRRKGTKDVDGTRTYGWYQIYYPQHLRSVIEGLEGMHPVLTLCEANWKVEHMLMCHFNNNKTRERKAKRRQQPSSSGTSKSTRHPAPASTNPSASVSLASTSSAAPASAPAPSKRTRSTSDCSTTSQASKRPRPDTNSQEESSNSILESIFDNPKLPAPTNSTGTAKEPDPIDVSFIQVSPGLENLRTALQKEYPSVQDAPALLDQLGELLPASQAHESSAEVLEFLRALETADPNVPGISEDDTNAAWGHYQFTAGPKVATCLTSWEAVGSVSIACRLIAAALKTCRVARFLCSERDIQANSYTADAYLDILVSKLWELVKDLGVGPPGASPEEQEDTQQEETTRESVRISGLTIPQMKAWLTEKGVAFAPSSLKNKSDWVAFVISSGVLPSDEEMKGLSKIRKGKKT